MLQRVNLVDEFRSLPLDESPVGYFGNAGTYFVGLGMGMKDKGWLKEAQIFFKLACYTDPFNIKVWQKWLVFEEQSGNIKNIHQLAKTAFLFTRSEEFIRIYLSSADRWLTPLSESRGIMSCVDLEQPVDNNILVDLAKMHLKSNEVLPGLTLLNRVCQWYDFKLPVCSVLLFLARYL